MPRGTRSSRRGRVADKLGDQVSFVYWRGNGAFIADKCPSFYEVLFSKSCTLAVNDLSACVHCKYQIILIVSREQATSLVLWNAALPDKS